MSPECHKRCTGLVSLALVVAACKSSPSDAGSAPSASVAAPQEVPVQASAASVAPTDNPWMAPFGNKRPIPTGPLLAIEAGKGLGPIRLTALATTVERLMGQPCQVREKHLCRYVARAVDFTLNDENRVTRIYVHRVGRKAGNHGHFGVFNGAIPPDLQFGMLPSAIQEHLGKPLEVTKGDEGSYPGTAESHRYDGMVLEYEAMPSGQRVLSGVRIPN